MLTDAEQNLVQLFFARGPSALFEDADMDLESARAFLDRDDVQQQLVLLRQEMDRADGFEARMRFVARRQMSKLVPSAVALHAQAMAGPIYARDKDGNILRDSKGNFVVQQAEPTRVQIKASENILEGLNITDPRLALLPPDKAGSIDIDNMSEKVIEQEVEVTKIEYDPGLETEEQRALSRERVRNALELLSPALQNKLATVKETTAEVQPEKPTPKKKAAAKKTAKKKAGAKPKPKASKK